MDKNRSSRILQTKLLTTIENETIRNLLSAQRRIAESGNAKDVIRISRYLMRLAEKRGNVLIDIFPEGEKKWCDDPVNNLYDLHEDTIGADT